MTNTFNPGDFVRRLSSNSTHVVRKTQWVPSEGPMFEFILLDTKPDESGNYVPAEEYVLYKSSAKTLKFEDILPGDVIQIRINPRPGYKGLTHDPMTVKAIARQNVPELATITFSDAKNVLGHSVERSEYTLISRPKPDFQAQLDDLGIIQNEIYYREDAALFYRFIGDGKAQYTRFSDGWRDLVVDYPHISLIKKGRIVLYV